MDSIKNWVVAQCWYRPHNCKESFFTSMISQERLRNVEKWKTRVQGVQNEYCFPLLSMHIFFCCCRRRHGGRLRSPMSFNFSQDRLACLLTSHYFAKCEWVLLSFYHYLVSVSRAICHFWSTMASWAFIPSPGRQSGMVVSPSRPPLWRRFFHTMSCVNLHVFLVPHSFR